MSWCVLYIDLFNLNSAGSFHQTIMYLTMSNNIIVFNRLWHHPTQIFKITLITLFLLLGFVLSCLNFYRCMPPQVRFPSGFFLYLWPLMWKRSLWFTVFEGIAIHMLFISHSNELGISLNGSGYPFEKIVICSNSSGYLFEWLRLLYLFLREKSHFYCSSLLTL